jgi:hypothetical protein
MIPITIQWIELHPSRNNQIKKVNFIGFSQCWIHPDFNPDGIRECFVNGDGGITSAYWNNCADEYCTDTNSRPTHFLELNVQPLKELFSEEDKWIKENDTQSFGEPNCPGTL